MRAHLATLFATLCAALAVMAPSQSGAGVPRSHMETFSTTAFKDAAQTTANWNTSSGVLEFFPFIPSQVGSSTTSGNANGIVIDGDYAYIADFSAGLLTMDISDPADPVLLSTYAAVGQAVAVSGDYVYLASGSGGLKIINVASPSAPVLVGSIATSGATGIAVDGDYAYIADATSGLRVISISNPASPSIVGTYNTSGSATDVEVNGDYVYLADGSPGFLVFDVTTPASPVLLATVDTPGNNFGIDVRGNRAYVTDSTGLLLIYDLTNPASPSLVGSVEVASAGDVFANADRAYVAASSAGITVVDISDEASPHRLFTHDTTSAKDVVVEGDLAYLADGSGGFRVVEIALNVAEAIEAGIVPLNSLLDVAVAGTIAYATDMSAGLRIVDISDLGNPILRSTYAGSGTVTEVEAAGKYAYLADGSLLRVLNVINPDSPFQAASISLPEAAQGMFIDGDQLYVGCGVSGLRIYNVSQPTSPALLASYDTAGAARGILVAGNRAYLADASAGLLIFNVANPASPSLLGTYNTPNAAYEVEIAGNVAYVPDWFSLQVINIANPAAPTLLGSLATSNNFCVGLEGNRLYTSDSGVIVVDVTDPAQPTYLYTLEGSTTFSPKPIGSYALVYYNGLRITMLRQDFFDTTRSRGQSLSLPAASIPVVRARVSAVQSGIVNWEMTASGGSSWQGLSTDGTPFKFTTPGTDLRWRTTHKVGYPTVDARLDEATIDWFYESAESDRIADIPGDQGGEVRLFFGRSGYDFTTETTTPTTGYQVYARVDDAQFVKRIEQSGPGTADGGGRFPGLASFEEDRLRSVDGRHFVVEGGRAIGDMPSGTWEVVAWVAATQRDQYIARVPTNGDSTGSGIPWTAYCITTHTTTPSIWYASEPDSGYSIDNIPPQVPSGLSFSGPGVLAWNSPADEDFAYFSLFGSSGPTFDGTAVLITHTIQTSLNVAGSPYAYYHLTATDDADNRSGAASIASSTADTPDETALPIAFAMHSIRPNPSSTPVEIAFDLPHESAVAVEVFDPAGRRVRTLAERAFAPGSHHVIWDGKDGEGRKVRGGIYFVRMRAGVFEESQRMLRLN